MEKDAVFVSLHLCGLDAIAKVFRVRANTVRKWRKLGAPIYLVGKKWQACYIDLWRWIVANMIEKQI